MLGWVVVLSLAWAQPEAAPEQPLRSALQVDAGATCLELDELEDVIRDALRTDTVDARIQVALVGDAQDAFALEYTVRRSGEVIATRRFDAEATDCEHLHAVVGVSVALAIDATLLLPEPEPKPEPQPAPEPDPETPPELAARRADSAELEPSPWEGAVVVRGGVGFQAPPTWAGVGAVAVELRWRDRVSIDAGLVGARGGFVSVGEGRAAFTLVGAMLGLCGGKTFGRVHPRGCGGVVVGGALAKGQGFANARNDAIPWVGVTFGGDVRVRLTERVEFEVGADGLANLLRPAFDFVDAAGTRQAGREFPWVGGWSTTGIVVSFR